MPAPESAAHMTVPVGAWQRDWIQRHGGALDRSVTVHYVQTPSVFGDVRIRLDRPDLAHATSFADLSDDQLAQLARQNGFAGVATIEGNNATWHHEIDYQPAEGADIGRVERLDDRTMLEHALDASYVERWATIDPGHGRYLAVRVQRAGRVDQLLVVAGDHFIYARARTTPLPPGDSITDIIARTHPTRDQLIAYLDCEISHGRVSGWTIEHSTLPWLQGKHLAFAAQLTLDPDGRPVPRVAAADETWTVPVNTLGPTELRALLAPR